MIDNYWWWLITNDDYWLITDEDYWLITDGWCDLCYSKAWMLENRWGVQSLCRVQKHWGGQLSEFITSSPIALWYPWTKDRAGCSKNGAVWVFEPWATHHSRRCTTRTWRILCCLSLDRGAAVALRLTCRNLCSLIVALDQSADWWIEPRGRFEDGAKVVVGPRHASCPGHSGPCWNHHCLPHPSRHC